MVGDKRRWALGSLPTQTILWIRGSQHSVKLKSISWLALKELLLSVILPKILTYFWFCPDESLILPTQISCDQNWSCRLHASLAQRGVASVTVLGQLPARKSWKPSTQYSVTVLSPHTGIHGLTPATATGLLLGWPCYFMVYLCFDIRMLLPWILHFCTQLILYILKGLDFFTSAHVRQLKV